MKKFLSLWALVLMCLFFVSTDVHAADIAFYWNQQPENIKNYLLRTGTTIQVVDALPSSHMAGNQDLGVTLTHLSGGSITGTEIYIRRNFEQMLTHEIGHCVSHYNNIPFYWAKTPEFQQIWMLEAPSSGITEFWGYPTNTPVEFFAVGYDLYFNYPDFFKKKCPETYKYIKNVIANTI